MGTLNQGENDIYVRLNTAERELYQIHHSLAYKLGKVLCKLKIPFKSQLKRMAFKIYKHKA